MIAEIAVGYYKKYTNISTWNW